VVTHSITHLSTDSIDLPTCRFLDRGLDEVGPKGLDFLTVLAAHEGEGLVVDR
jgi:hypothetical protein